MRAPVRSATMLPVRCACFGGGNAKKLHIKLLKNVSITDNIAGLLGGIALRRD